MADEPERVAIVGGTGVYALPGVAAQTRIVETAYGPVHTMTAEAEPYPVVFLNRHGPNRRDPPHRINYRANLAALKALGVTKVVAINAVGSISRELPPLSLAVLDDFLDFTSGRPQTFYDGAETGHAYALMSPPYCPGLRRQLLDAAAEAGLPLHPRGTYVCTSGPRFESPAEIRMFAQLGGDVVGMTGVPEVALARELGLHYAAVAYSINWAAGLEDQVGIVHQGVPELVERLLRVALSALQQPGPAGCACAQSLLVVSPPQDPGGAY